MRSNKLTCLVSSVNKSRALARCFNVQPPDFHYTNDNLKYDIEKYNDDLNKIIRFNQHPRIVNCRPVHPSNYKEK